MKKGFFTKNRTDNPYSPYKYTRQKWGEYYEKVKQYHDQNERLRSRDHYSFFCRSHMRHLCRNC